MGNMFIVNNKTPEPRHSRRAGIFIANEHISHIFLVFLLLTLKRKC